MGSLAVLGAMGPAALLLLLLLPAVLPGLGAGDLEGAALGSRSPPLALELLLEGAGDLAVLPPELLLGDLLEPEPDCGELLAAFANSSVRLIGCLVRSARPVKVCQNCYRHYRQVKERLENITRVVGNTSESNPCAKSLLMSDRLQIVVLLSKFFTNTWNKANCANCLKNNSEGLSNSTMQFLALFNESLACFEHNIQGLSPPPSNYTEVCKNCNETYKKLNDMYNDMQKREQKQEAEEQAHLCIDVEDAMNITRRLWSTTFNCSVPCSDTVPVIAVSSFILFLPIVFYLSSFLHSKQKKRILIMPKRIQSNASFANIQEKSH